MRLSLHEAIFRLMLAAAVIQILIIVYFHHSSRSLDNMLESSLYFIPDIPIFLDYRPIIIHLDNSKQFSSFEKRVSSGHLHSKMDISNISVRGNFNSNTTATGQNFPTEHELDRLHVKFEKHASCQRYDWAMLSFPSCNQFHEMGTFPFSHHLAKGGVRDVWRSGRNSIGVNENVVLKTLRYNKEFNVKFYEMHRIDSLISERLGGSSASVGIYGHCANSAIYEGIESTVLQLDIKKLSSIEKLDISYQLALSLSKAHFALSSHSSEAAVLHRDVTAKNFVVTSENKFKINDFNAGHILDNCKFIKKECNGYRSPEECSGLPLSEKIDVYALGFVLNFLLNGVVPSKDTSKTASIVRKSLVSSFNNKRGPALEAIKESVRVCFASDPEQRPSSADLAEMLKVPLDGIKYENK